MTTNHTTPETIGRALQRATAARGEVTEQLRAADAKATALLGLFGGVLAGVLALATTAHLGGVATGLLYTAAFPAAVAVVLLLLALRPCLDGPAPAGFLRWAQLPSPQHVLADLRLPEEIAAAQAAIHLLTLSRLARAKYHCIRTAVGLLLAAGLPLAVAIPFA